MQWITENANQTNNHLKINDIDIFILKPLGDSIDVEKCFNMIFRSIPDYLTTGIDVIYIGDFDIFKEREVNAVFKDGGIYISNEQDNEMDMIDDVIHEVAHGVEKQYQIDIYDDGFLAKEFLGKRRRLFSLLRAEGYGVDPLFKIKTEFSREIDDYLYRDVGYPTLWTLATGLFLSPYSMTSLSEYFAIGFEHYYISDRKSLKEICPVLYSKIENLNHLED